MPDWKHSQYFLRQADFLQAQPLACYLSLYGCAAASVTTSACPIMSIIELRRPAAFCAAIACADAAAAECFWLPEAPF